MKKVYIIPMRILSIAVVCNILIWGIFQYNSNTINTSTSETTDFSSLSNKKVCWGIKRADNHEQPDVGSENVSLMEKCNGIYMGNSEKKYVYLTFDAGYEARLYRKYFRSTKAKQCNSHIFYNRALFKHSAGFSSKND